MLSTRLARHPSARGSAAQARHRLLTDCANPPTSQKEAAPAARRTGFLPLLSPADQRALVQAVANSFPTCYLANTAYLDDCDLTVATLLPRATELDPVGAQRISVDAAGNVSVSAWTPPPAEEERPVSSARRLLTALTLVVFIVSCTILAL